MSARNLPEMRSPTTGAPFAIFQNGRPHWTGKVELIESKLTEPIRWRKPGKIFVNSMSDLWHENLTPYARARVYATMAYCQWHTYLVLTKRALLRRVEMETGEFEADVRVELGKLLERFGPPPHAKPFRWPLPNVWEGASVEDEDTAQRRISNLISTPAAVRWISYEPALQWVDLERWLEWLDWAVIGGESGTHARPFHVDWARWTIEIFKRAHRPLFVKQVGYRPVWNFPNLCEREVARLKDTAGADMAEWPPDLRVREYPKAA
jgi:protein gp37